MMSLLKERPTPPLVSVRKSAPRSSRTLADEIADFTLDPLGFVKCVYPWGEGDLSESNGPRAWQAMILDAVGKHLRNPQTRYKPFSAAVASGHGIGKSALVGFLIDWAMSTCDDCKIVVTANTGTQLATKTQPEVAKWFAHSINKYWWDVKATSITSKAPAHERLWRTDFISWSENNTEAFAGLHNKGKRIVVVYDEASAISDKVWEVTEGSLTDKDTEILWLAFGNPTQNTGRFRECFGSRKHRWQGFQIDSRTVEGTNKDQIAQWIADYGEDSDFVRVRVRGEFPRSGSAQFISIESVEKARYFKAEGFSLLPKIMSVDVARFGDDQSVIGLRQGRKFGLLAKYRGMDTVQLAERVIEFMEKEEPDAVVVDADGVGAGVVDQIKFRGFSKKLFEFHGGAPANQSSVYFNRRAEMWGLMREWIVAGAEIPDDPELAADLVGPEYGFSNKSQIQLEKKEDMKKRGLSSPDLGDCLAMSFAVKVAAPHRKVSPISIYPGQLSESWMT